MYMLEQTEQNSPYTLVSEPEQYEPEESIHKKAALLHVLLMSNEKA